MTTVGTITAEMTIVEMIIVGVAIAVTCDEEEMIVVMEMIEVIVCLCLHFTILLNF